MPVQWISPSVLLYFNTYKHLYVPTFIQVIYTRCALFSLTLTGRYKKETLKVLHSHQNLPGTTETNKLIQAEMVRSLLKDLKIGYVKVLFCRDVWPIWKDNHCSCSFPGVTSHLFVFCFSWETVFLEKAKTAKWRLREPYLPPGLQFTHISVKPCMF